MAEQYLQNSAIVNEDGRGNLRSQKNTNSAKVAAMPADPDQRRRALKAFQATYLLRTFPWCKAARVAESTLRGFLNGDQDSLGDRNYEKLAAAASELLVEKRQGKPVTAAELRGEQPTALVKIEAYVGAGAEIRPIDGDHLGEWLEAPPFGQPLSAALVRGDSALPMFEDDDVLFYPAPRRALVGLIGRVVIADLQDGRRLVKRLQRGQKPGRWHLLSINPASPMIENVAIDAAAPIAWVRRKG